MPTSNIDFPAALAARQDSAHFKVEREDKTIRGSMEGGYEHTRPRHTRRNRRIFTTGFTDISQAEFEALEDFYDQVGGHTNFNWVNPTNGENFVVRFEKPIAGKYIGAGGNHRYEVINVRLKEA